MSGEQPVSECLFCRWRDPALNRILCESERFYVRYDNYPANPGHVEIVPKRHVVSLFDLSPGEAADAHELMLEAQRLLDAKYHPDGYTIGANEGRAAGRSVDHLHIHLIPRYWGDVKDPRGGVRQAAPNCDPDSWGARKHTGGGDPA